MNKISIIGGKWRSLVVEFLDEPGLRPTPNRVRETLFNWLALDIVGACVLDLFAGSGVLAFESLSRGASKATLIDNNPKIYTQLNKQYQKLSRNKNNSVNIICIDADKYLQKYKHKFDIVFLDPPFSDFDAVKLLKQVISANILQSGSKIYLEASQALNNTQLPQALSLQKAKKAADVYYHLLHYDTNSNLSGFI